VLFIRRAEAFEFFPSLAFPMPLDSVPERVASAIQEAVDCHGARSFVAAALLIRKTLKEICVDHGATGDTLKARLNSLKTNVILPQQFFDGMQQLRVLGVDDEEVVHRRRNRPSVAARIP
jgi:hypothetical protein